jgi:hypothetical protein
LSLGSPQFEMQQNPVEFKPVAKKKEPVEGLILSSSCPGELSPKQVSNRQYGNREKQQKGNDNPAVTMTNARRGRQYLREVSRRIALSSISNEPVL